MSLLPRRDAAARRPASSRRRSFLQMEQLEERTVLAGNVIANAAGGSLMLIGDSAANQIAVTRVGASSVQITSLDTTTRINGQTSITLNNVTQSLTALMGNGDDVLELRGSTTEVFRMFGATTINSGEGNDTVRFRNYSSWGSLALIMGGGNDTVVGELDSAAPAVTVGGLRVGAPAVISMGAGNDTVSLRNSTFQSTAVIDGSTGNDQFDIRNSAFQSVTLLSGSLGNDSLNNAGNTYRYPPVVSLFESQTSVSGPNANNDTATVAEGGNVAVTVLSNDTASSGTLNASTVTIVQTPMRGTAVVNPDGTISYTNGGGEFASDTLTYTVRDSNGNISNVATVNITVTPVNDLPVAVADAFTVDEGSTTTFNLGANDTDAENRLNLGSIVITQQPANGTVTVGTGGNVTYVNTSTTATSDSFQYTIADQDGGTSLPVTVSITINSTNDAPTIGAIDPQSTNEDTVTGAIAVTVNDAETPAANLTVSATSSNLTLVPNANIVVGGSGSNRTLTITPAANQAGTSTITVTVTDENNESTSTTFVLTVNAQNDAPTIAPVADITTAEDTPAASFDISIDDLETPNGLTVTASSSNQSVVADGGVGITGTGTTRSIIVTPAAEASGQATITLTVSDGTATTTETFVVTVTPENDLPTITAINDVTVGVGATIDPIAVTVGDVESAATALTVTATSDNQAVITDGGIQVTGTGASRTINITPVNGATGTANIVVRVTDEANGFVETVFTVTIDSPPTISTIADQTISEDGSTASLLFTVGDSQTAPVDLTLSATSSNPTLIPVGNIEFGGSGAGRAVVVTPVANASGSSTIRVTVTDENGLTAFEEFVVTVTPQNDNPTLAAISNINVTEDAPIAPFNITVGDLETPVDNLTVTASSDNQALVADNAIVVTGTGATRQVTITQVANASGTANVTLTVDDGDGGTASRTFAVTIAAANDAPLAVDDNGDLDFPEASTIALMLTGNVVTNDSDPDAGATLSVTNVGAGTAGQVVQLTYGTLVINSDGSYTYTIDPAAVDELLAGAEVQESINYTLSDGQLTDIGQLTIDIHITAAAG